MVRLRCELVLALCALGCGGGITSRTVSEAGAEADPAGGAQSVAEAGRASAGTAAAPAMGGSSAGGAPAAGGAAAGQPVCSPSPNPTPLRALSSWEYSQSVRALTGQAVSSALSDDSKPFAPFAYSMDLGSQKVQQLFSEAEQQGSAARDAGQLQTCETGVPIESCAGDLVDSFVGRAFRRPLNDDERARYVSLFKVASGGGDLASGVELVVTASLLSPLFLHKVYLGDGTTARGSTPLTPFEVAARLSLLFTGAPTDGLWHSADNGDLATDSGVEQAARRLLSNSTLAMQHFHDQWLGLDELDRFVSAELSQGQVAAMRLETEDFIDSVFRGKRRLPELLESSADPRRTAGVLTQASTLLRFDNPTRRGRFVRERLLCGVVPPPPPQIPKTIEVRGGQTRRQAWEQHLTEPSCAACHQLMDPIGFGLEAFDELGRYRVVDNGLPVDASGSVILSDGSDFRFVGAGELGTLLGKSSVVGKCLAKTWLGYALQRPTDAADDCVVDSVYGRFSNADLDIGELLVAVATSPRFRTRDAYAVPSVAAPEFSPGPTEPLAARRKLVLDFAVMETRWLQQLVPTEDRQVLDQYLSSLRDLEIQLSQGLPSSSGP